MNFGGNEMAYTVEQQKEIMDVVQDIFSPSNTTASFVSDSYIAVQNISFAQAKLKDAIAAGTVTDAASVVNYLYDCINNFDPSKKEDYKEGGSIKIQPRMNRAFSRNTDNIVERFMLQSSGDPNQLYVELQSRLYPLLEKIDNKNKQEEDEGNTDNNNVITEG